MSVRWPNATAENQPPQPADEPVCNGYTPARVRSVHAINRFFSDCNAVGSAVLALVLPPRTAQQNVPDALLIFFFLTKPIFQLFEADRFSEFFCGRTARLAVEPRTGGRWPAFGKLQPCDGGR